MPSKSKAQQGLMGAVHAAKKGEKPASPEVAKIAKGMTKKAAKDFASTSTKGLPEKVKEARTEVKDKDGKVTSWKDEGEWKKADGKKNPRGRVTNLSDKARRETEKSSKAEKEMAEAFEQAMEGTTITQGANKGKQWSPKTPGPTNPNYKPFDKNGIPSPDDGATAPPPGYKAPKATKKAEVTPTVSTDDTEMTAESKKKVSKVKAAMDKNKMKALKENIDLVMQMLAEAKKTAKKKDSKVKEDPNEGNAFGKAVQDAKKDGIQKGEKVKVGKKEYPVKESSKEKCNHTAKGKKCPVHGLKECGSMYEGNDGNLANNAKPYDKVTKGDVVAGRLGKDEMGGKKKKSKKMAEGKDLYMESLRQKLNNQLNG